MNKRKNLGNYTFYFLKEFYEPALCLGEEIEYAHAHELIPNDTSTSNVLYFLSIKSDNPDLRH